MALGFEFNLGEQAGILERAKDFALKNRLEIDGSLNSIFEFHLQTIISDYFESEDSVYRMFHRCLQSTAVMQL